MKDYESLTCLEIKQILKKHKITGYSNLSKQELIKLVKKTLNNKKIKKGGSDPVEMKNITQQNIPSQNVKFTNEDFSRAIMYISQFHGISPNDKIRIIQILNDMRKLNLNNNTYANYNKELGNIQNKLNVSEINKIFDLNKLIDSLLNQIRLSKQQQ
jgi:hypothetical protein